MSTNGIAIGYLVNQSCTTSRYLLLFCVFRSFSKISISNISKGKPAWRGCDGARTGIVGSLRLAHMSQLFTNLITPVI